MYTMYLADDDKAGPVQRAGEGQHAEGRVGVVPGVDGLALGHERAPRQLQHGRPERLG